MTEPRPAFGPDDLRVARALADELIATAEPSKYWDRIEELTPAECRALDSIAFECACCNQWYEIAMRCECGARYFCAGCAGSG